MSFLLLEDDPQATLHDALALIDACESGDGTSGAGSASINSSSSSDELLDTDDDDAPSPPSAPVNDQSSLRVVIRNPPSLDDLALLFNREQTQALARPTQQQQQKKKSAPAHKKESRASAVKKHRERKKNEMQTLREQAVQLESRLARLQRSARARGFEHSSRGSSSSSNASASEPTRHLSEQQLVPRASTWLDFAALREKERFQSEALNMKLRDALRRQLLASKALDGVLSKKRAEACAMRFHRLTAFCEHLCLELNVASVVGLELLQRQQLTELRQQRDVCLMITTRLSEPTVLAQLQANLHQMFLKSDSVFNCAAGGSIDAQGTGSGSAASMHVNETHDPVAGMSVETRSNTRVRCSFQEAGQVMWQGAAPLQAPTTGPCSVVRRALTNASFQKSFNIVLDGYEHHPVGLSGSAYTHKFDEDERFLFMWTSTIVLSSNSSTTFVEKGWVVATALPSSAYDGGAPLSIVKTCYQASCPSPPGDPQTRGEVAFVLKWLARKTRDYNQRMQDVFSDKYSDLYYQGS